MAQTCRAAERILWYRFASLGRAGRAACLKHSSFGEATWPAQSRCIKGGSLMLRTLFFLAVVIWMLGLMFQFGESVLHILLVVGAIMLVMKFTFRRHSLY